MTETEGASEPPWMLLSAYRSDSHAAWANWLCSHFGDRVWQRLELPGRHFRWRIRGNPLSWLEAIPPGAPAAVVATSMVDLATLRGLHPQLANAPTLYYFHENQFAYPTGEAQHRSVDPQMVQLYGALAADRIAFNSAWNRDSFLAGVDALLGHLPDALPHGVVERLQAKSSVCPVPISTADALDDGSPGAKGESPRAGAAFQAPPRDPRLILWNHRWEYDKDPEHFAEAMLALAAQGVDFRLALLGKRPAHAPAALEQLRQRLGPRIIADGHLAAMDYRRLLAQAGIVVSTARHEFQGLAVLEAVDAGATPLVPDALAYREQYGAAYRYPAGDQSALCERLRSWLAHGAPPAPDVRAWRAEALSVHWGTLLDGLMGAKT